MVLKAYRRWTAFVPAFTSNDTIDAFAHVEAGARGEIRFVAYA